MGLLFARRRPWSRAAAADHEQDRDARPDEPADDGYDMPEYDQPAPIYVPPPRPDGISEPERPGTTRAP